MFTVTGVFSDGSELTAYAVSLEGAREAEQDMVRLGCASVTVEGDNGEEIEEC